jgi:hypothetical protein
MISTAIFIISIVSSFIAICLYFPLICSIKGNLKEYICHKVEKRIAELIANHGMKRRNQRGDSPGPKQAPRGTHIGGSLSKDLEFNDRMQREPPVMEMSQRRNFPSYLHSNPPSLQRNHPQHQNYHQHQQQHFITPQRALTDPFASRETVDRRYQSPQIASHIASQPQENWRHNNIDIQFISPPTSRPASPPIGKKQSTRPSPNNSLINPIDRGFHRPENNHQPVQSDRDPRKAMVCSKAKRYRIGNSSTVMIVFRCYTSTITKAAEFTN